MDAHADEHVIGKQRERGGHDGSQEGVGGDGGGGEHKIRIDEIIKQAQEDSEDAEAREQTRQRGHDPGNGVPLIARPAEPEQAAREGEAAEDGDGETPFRDGDVVVVFEFADVGGVEEDHDDEGDAFAHHHAEVGEARLALVEAVFAFEDEGVSGQEEIEETVDEGPEESSIMC